MAKAHISPANNAANISNANKGGNNFLILVTITDRNTSFDFSCTTETFSHAGFFISALSRQNRSSRSLRSGRSIKIACNCIENNSKFCDIIFF